MKQLFEDFLKLSVGVMVIIGLVVVPAFVALLPIIIPLCMIFSVVVFVLAGIKSVVGIVGSASTKRQENLRQDSRWRR